MAKGYLALVLHAHLPFVYHPEYQEFLEERWFFEALTDTYLPLLNMLEQLTKDGVDYKLTLNLSPSLCNMFANEALQDRYLTHLQKILELCEKEINRTRCNPGEYELAVMYYTKFVNTKKQFLYKHGRDLISAFRKYQEKGSLEIITCAATHGFLPLMSVHPQAVRAQVRVGVRSYRKFFGCDPKGIWVPECGYFDGLDMFLKEEGIKYFLVETHGVLFANPRPKYGVYSSYYTKNGVAVFGRDRESSKSVWSAKEGYPGDHLYREYYRDIGFDLDYDYVKPYISPCGARVFTGVKYHRITGETTDKHLYQPEKALEKAAEHAGNFMFNRQKQIEYLSSFLDKKPIIVAPYDAELYGHWWYEGIPWLNFLIRKIAYDQDVIKLTTPFNYLVESPRNQVISPSASSWGWKGYYEVWLNGSNDWIYPHLHRAQECMINQARNNNFCSDIQARVLNQMARELLLAQSSDWAFMMKTGAFAEYGKKRTETHLERFWLLNNFLVNDSGFQLPVLEDLENKDGIFPELQYSVYQ